MDKVIVINVNEKARINRILSEGKWNYDEVVVRIQNQMASEEKIKYAHFVLDNSKSKESLKEEIKNLYAKLCILASENNSKIIT